MGLVKLILAIAITIVVMIALITRIPTNVEETQISHERTSEKKRETNLVPPPNKKVSRFLAEKARPYRNPKAADHCNSNEKKCRHQGGANSTMACCGNKCFDLANDKDNCGACKNKCKFTQTCCRGECVYLAYDKRHCGECNHRCPDNEYCVYGMCSYA